MIVYAIVWVGECYGEADPRDVVEVPGEKSDVDDLTALRKWTPLGASRVALANQHLRFLCLISATFRKNDFDS